MKINLPKKDIEQLQLLFEVRRNNIIASEMLNDLFLIRDVDFSYYYSSHSHHDNDKALEECAIDILGIDRDDQNNKDFITQYLQGNFKLLSEEEYNKNPYYSTVKLKDISFKNYKLTYLNYPPYSYFPLNDVKSDSSYYYKEINTIGSFPSSFSYLSLMKGNEVWMCITPNEIQTMQDHINRAKGNVITFGLGLGYYAFMLSLKEDVKSITIVEYDNNIINLFTNYIYKYFPHQNKIMIIKADMYHYLKNNDINAYDYIFVDTYHDTTEALQTFLNINKLSIKKEIHYWLEDSIIALIRRYLITLIEEQYQGFDDLQYQNSNSFDDEIINLLYSFTKNRTFTSFSHIIEFLSDKSIYSLFSNK